MAWTFHFFKNYQAQKLIITFALHPTGWVTTTKVVHIVIIISHRIGHDNEGRSANWYVEGVDIIHPSIEESVDFTAGVWLGDSISRRDGGEQACETELFSVQNPDEEGKEVLSSVSKWWKILQIVLKAWNLA